MDAYQVRRVTSPPERASARRTQSESFERDLIERIRRRDDRAAAELFDTYAGTLLALAKSVVGNDEDADEIVEDTIVHIWENPRAWKPEKGALGKYLSVFARSRALDRRRKMERRLTLRDERAAVEEPGTVFEPQRVLSPEEVLTQNELRAAAVEALTHVSDLQREALDLAYFQGLTQTEIAERLGAPLGTVKSRLRDGLLALRSRFSAGGEGAQ